jgi:chemotaxis protein MotA
MDLPSLIGTVLGLTAVFGGAMLEGLHLGDLLIPTAAMIVFGGTAAAMMVSFPPQDVKRALGLIGLIYKKVDLDVRPTIEEIIRIATIARKEGVLAVEGQRESIQNPLFKKSIKYVVDGFEPNTVKEIIDTEIYLAFEEEEAAGKVWEGAGGYSPTIGIIGAVLGLIHVMKSLDDPSKIGSGIAVAFVATVYGVGMANLILIPWGTKLKRKAAQRMMVKEVVKLGVTGIQEGLNPHFLKEKMEVFVEEHLRHADEGKKE